MLIKNNYRTEKKKLKLKKINKNKKLRKYFPVPLEVRGKKQGMLKEKVVII